MSSITGEMRVITKTDYGQWMKYVDQTTGESVKLFKTPEMTLDIDNYKVEFRCEHSDKKLCNKKIKGDNIQIRYQCLRCGQAVGNAIHRTDAHKNLPTFDELLQQKYEEERKTAHDNLLHKHFLLQKDNDITREERYNKYMASPEWAKKRKKILWRADGMCEGCADKPAKEIHHLTYEHIYNEFLFELVALCKDCHDRVHADSSRIRKKRKRRRS